MTNFTIVQTEQLPALVDRLRAALAKAEAERDDVMRHVEKLMLRTEAAEARAEKAATERDQFKQLHRHALNCVDQVFQPCGEIPNPVLPDFCELGEDKTTIEMQVRLRAWQPIETAPRDGTPILACHDYTQRTDLAAHPRTVAWIDRVGHGSPCWRNAYGHIERHITHWMPLPDPPREARRG